MKFLVYIASFLVILASCKKEELQPEVIGNAAFYIQGTVNGLPVNLVAGDNDYYMYSSFEENENTVPKYIGELKTENCETGCPESFTIIYTGEKEAVEGLAVEPELRTGFKPFTNPNAGNEYEVAFNPEESFTSKAIEVDYEWEFGDGTISKEKNPTHLFVGDQEFFEVKLNVKTSKGCESNIENRIYIKSETTTDFLITQTQRSLAFEPDVKDIAPQNYLWEFESGNTASTPYVDYQADPNKGIEKVCLTVTDENGVRSQRCKNLILKEEYAFCAANYSFKSASRQDPNGELQLGTVYLKYTDAAGKEYYSRPNLNDNNEFELLSVADYDENEMGNPTKQITFHANTTLTSLDGQELNVENLSGSIAVAYRAK
ncbi:MAG: hypothetical protein CL842_01755 [Crocinitomicaceae bacterium]|nr:hypothetical protein [Crocinitomicaceae bacterium]|tara:strand:- start:41566 stop:42687 length:1122 start_codon:yes stop_codon:yes gene_type:complete